MATYDAEPWKDLAVAQVGVAAVLIGLTFIALSINLKDILASRGLVNRALESITAFGMVMFSASCLLVPQSRTSLAVEFIIAGLSTLVCVLWLQRDARRSSQHTSPVNVVVRRLFGLSPPLLLLICGVSLALQAGGGLYWWPFSVLLGLFGSLTAAWVLLVEILR